MKERDTTVEQVQREHLADVHLPTQWLYLFSVLAGGTVLMIGLIALLGALGSS